MGLVRSLQTWAILLIYCNNQFKKYITPLLTLARRARSIPLLMSLSEAFSVSFYTLIKLCYTKALEWSSLVPRPKVKSLEITSLTFCHKLLPSSRGSSWPRDWTTSSGWGSWLAGGFFTTDPLGKPGEMLRTSLFIFPPGSLLRNVNKAHISP